MLKHHLQIGYLTQTLVLLWTITGASVELFVCPVCNVGVLWPNGWMDQDVTGTEVGLGPGDIVLDGDPAPHTAAPTFRPMAKR